VRAPLPNETGEEYAALLKAARSGTAEPHTMLEPHVVGVSAMKLRNYGQHEGKRVTLGFHHGRVVDIPERDRYTTSGGYVRKVIA
jgi:hypothetical protein